MLTKQCNNICVYMTTTCEDIFVKLIFSRFFIRSTINTLHRFCDYIQQFHILTSKFDILDILTYETSPRSVGMDERGATYPRTEYPIKLHPIHGQS